jgi:hypothetical protein
LATMVRSRRRSPSAPTRAACSSLPTRGSGTFVRAGQTLLKAHQSQSRLVRAVTAARPRRRRFGRSCPGPARRTVRRRPVPPGPPDPR